MAGSSLPNLPGAGFYRVPAIRPPHRTPIDSVQALPTEVLDCEMQGVSRRAHLAATLFSHTLSDYSQNGHQIRLVLGSGH